MNIKDMSEQELKALAFDEVNKRDIASSNLNLIIQELNSRQKQTFKPEIVPTEAQSEAAK